MTVPFQISSEELKVFLEEAEEELALLEQDLVLLEKEADNQELLQEIFRAAHTLKGSSATIGHQKMAQITHLMENLLDQLRHQELEMSPELTDVLLEAVDVLVLLKDEIAEQKDLGIDITGIVARLQSFQEIGPGNKTAAPAYWTNSTPTEPLADRREVTSSAGTIPAVEAASTAEKLLAPPAGGAVSAGDAIPAVTPPGEAMASVEAVIPETPTLEEAEKLREAGQRGLTPLVAEIRLQEDCLMPSVRAYQAFLALADAGEVLGSRPPLEDIEQDRVENRVVFFLASRLRPEEISAALLTISEVAAARVEKLALALPAPGRNSPPLAPNGDGTGGDVGAARTNLKAGISHSVRVDVDLLDNLMNLVGELVIDRNRLAQFLGDFSLQEETGQDLGQIATHLSRVTSELQEEIMRARMLPVENLFKKFPRMVRDLAQKAGKEINFLVEGQETELDRSVIEEIGDPLMHLLRNAIDHGIESPAEREAAGKPRVGTIRLTARHEENRIIITVQDDGRGIDPEKVRRSAVKKGLLTEEAANRLSDDEAIDLIFVPGFSTAERVTEVSGRGVGMDVVRRNLERLNGSVEVDTTPGQGTTFRITLPLTLAIIQALLVEGDEVVFAIPLGSVVEALHLKPGEARRINKKEVIQVRGEVVPLVRLTEVFWGQKTVGPTSSEAGEEGANDVIPVVMVNVAGRHLGIAVDALLGEQEVVIKGLGSVLGDIPGVAGATILGDGRVALIMDVAGFAKLANVQTKERVHRWSTLQRDAAGAD